jgi:hypothetical protein
VLGDELQLCSLSTRHADRPKFLLLKLFPL